MASSAPAALLTAKETEVLALVQRRLTNVEIAAQLYVSVRTVETHVSSILRKLGAANRRELAAMAGTVAPAGERSLPALRTELVGRGDDVAAVSAQVERVRLTTLVGPGGVGKTSVALAVAHEQGDRWPDGVAFVDLVPARTPGDVLRTITDAMGVDGEASRSSHDLGRHLATRTALIVLDNCEHVVGHVAELLHVALGQGGSSHVLATSREPLGLGEEHLVPIEPLGDAAAELFVERARRSDPRTDWDPSDERIVDLCARLDGLPLALELAAGQLRRWSLDELRRRLADPDAALPDRPTRGEPRHRTMDLAIGWSYGLLDDAEQSLLRHLGVFPSTFTLDAVDAVASLVGGIDLAATLASLVDKSLVGREPGADSYRLLETIRSFAVERLDEHGERDAAFEQHRRWTVGRATATSRLDRWFSARLAGQQRVEAEHVRQAFWASLGSGHLADAVDLAVTRSFLWRSAVGCAEGRRWLEALADRDLDPADAAWIWILRCDVAQGDGDFVRMVTAATDAMRTASEVDPVAHVLAQHFDALQHLLDASRVDRALADVLDTSPDERLSNLLRAFSLCAHAGRLERDELRRRIDELERSCSPDGYERFIHNWAVWMHGLALKESTLAHGAITRQYEFLDRAGLAETWLTAYSLAVTQMIDGVSGREQLAHALEIAEREGYRIEGDCALALAYSEVCAGEPAAAAELLGLARTCGFNATAHHVLHGVVVDPLVRRQLSEDEVRAAMALGRERSAATTLSDYGIRALNG